MLTLYRVFLPVVGMILFLLIGFLGYRNYQTEKIVKIYQECLTRGGSIGESNPPTCIFPPPNSPTPSPTPSSSPTPSKPKDQSDDLLTDRIRYQPNLSWQTYQDTKAGLTIQYPPYYKLREKVEGDHADFLNCSGPDGLGLCISGFSLQIYHDYNQGSRRAWLKSVYPPLYKPYFQNLIIDNKKALLAIEGNPGGSSALMVVIPKQKTMVMFSMSFVAWDPDTGKLPDLSFVKQILATFKFTGG